MACNGFITDAVRYGSYHGKEDEEAEAKETILLNNSSRELTERNT